MRAGGLELGWVYRCVCVCVCVGVGVGVGVGVWGGRV